MVSKNILDFSVQVKAVGTRFKRNEDLKYHVINVWSSLPKDVS